MRWVRFLIASVISLGIACAGLPVQASLPCPMAAQMSMQSDTMKDCKGCPPATQKQNGKQSKKNGCCDDVACNSKCAAGSSSASMLSPVIQFSHDMVQRSYHAFTRAPSLQNAVLGLERPPKQPS